MTEYRTRGMTLAEVWFDEPTAGIKADIIRHYQSLVPLTRGTSTVFYTLVVDLTQPEAHLLQQMTKDNRYEIRRATEKDKLTLWCWDRVTDEEVRKFASYYNEFAAGKGLACIEYEKLARLQQARCLDLSSARDSEGNALVYHAYYLGTSRVRLLHSASVLRRSGDSTVRSLVGRANRWLHWQDFQRFKAEKKTVYDFGGVYKGNTDEDRMRINEFKESFGGKLEENYNGDEFITLRAKVARRARRLLQLVKRKNA
jgi:hypothetical protein